MVLLCRVYLSEGNVRAMSDDDYGFYDDNPWAHWSKEDIFDDELSNRRAKAAAEEAPPKGLSPEYLIRLFSDRDSRLISRVDPIPPSFLRGLQARIELLKTSADQPKVVPQPLVEEIHSEWDLD